MKLFARSVPVAAALGLAATGLMVVPGGAATAATSPVCETAIHGVLPSGKLTYRYVKNTKLIDEKKSATALPGKVESLYGNFAPEQIEGGQIITGVLHSAGAPARFVKFKRLTDSPTLTIMSLSPQFRPTPKARTWAGAGRFWTYAITPNGNLTRFSRLGDNAGHTWIGNPRVVKTGMAKIKSMSFMFTGIFGGVKKDILYATTGGGALLQIQIPWNTPGKPKITTLKSTGFAAVTSLSLSVCDQAGRYASIIAVERGNNRARWWTLAGQFSPKPANLTRRPLVAPGAEWRLRATT
jgi:hypothetical protein